MPYPRRCSNIRVAYDFVARDLAADAFQFADSFGQTERHFQQGGPSGCLPYDYDYDYFGLGRYPLANGCAKKPVPREMLRVGYPAVIPYATFL
jgi:hypothetical protein